MGLDAAQRSPRKRHKPVDVAAPDRAHRAHQRRLGGADWSVIATEVGYANGPIAAMAVNAYLQKVAIEQGPDFRRAALALELARLDKLQASHWEMAMAGDLNAANFVLKIIIQRCRILGFDKAEELTAAPPRTVVIGGTGEEYVATLKALIAERDQTAAR